MSDDEIRMATEHASLSIQRLHREQPLTEPDRSDEREAPIYEGTSMKEQQQ